MATSQLQAYVTRSIRNAISGLYEVYENTRPPWLKTDANQRLELDVFIPQLNIAVEVQGEQHFGYVPHFHKTYTGFVRRKALDATKREICHQRGITLLEVSCKEGVGAVIKMILSRSKAATELATFSRRFQSVFFSPRVEFKRQLQHYRMLNQHVRQTTHNLDQCNTARQREKLEIKLAQTQEQRHAAIEKMGLVLSAFPAYREYLLRTNE